MPEKIKVIICRVGADPVVEEIEHGLESLQRVVGGYIEVIRLDDDVAMICNEQAALEGLPRNRKVGDYTIFGDLVVVGSGDGEMVSLTDEQIDHWRDRLQLPEDFHVN